MSDLAAMMAADAGTDQAGPVQRVAALVKLAVEQQKALEAQAASMALAKAALTRTLMEDIPELMTELTLSEIKLDDGTEVKVVPEVDCAITEVNRDKAHEWLRERGFGGLIKSAVSVFFGRDEEELKERVVDAINSAIDGDEAHAPELAEAVHPGTLKAFVKERLAAAAEAPGDVPPTELFSIYSYSKAKVVPPKAPKAAKVKKAG